MKDFFKNANFISIIVLFISALIIAFIWYSPILFKGYSPNIIYEQIILAKNLAKSGVYGLYNDHGVLLASDLMKETLTIFPVNDSYSNSYVLPPL